MAVWNDKVWNWSWSSGSCQRFCRPAKCQDCDTGVQTPYISWLIYLFCHARTALCALTFCIASWNVGVMQHRAVINEVVRIQTTAVHLRSTAVHLRFCLLTVFSLLALQESILSPCNTAVGHSLWPHVHSYTTLVAQGSVEKTCPSKQPQLRDSLLSVKTGNRRKAASHGPARGPKAEE